MKTEYFVVVEQVHPLGPAYSYLEWIFYVCSLKYIEYTLAMQSLCETDVYSAVFEDSEAHIGINRISGQCDLSRRILHN